jgi:hypothetical protein
MIAPTQFSFSSTNNAHQVNHSEQQKNLYLGIKLIPWYKTYTMVGFDPGSSVPEADAMSTAPSSGRFNSALNDDDQKCSQTF